MKILVIEYVTGGGLYRQPLPDSLVVEGEGMLQTLLADLAADPSNQLFTTRDRRMPELQCNVMVWPVSADQDPWALWQAKLAEVDAVWPIAPESGAALASLTRLIERSGICLLGSSSAAVVLTGSKRATSERLLACGIQAVQTCLPSEFESLAGPWVVKPDDGAGCEDTRCFDDAEALADWLAQEGRALTHVVQPFLAGTAMSLSMLCHEGEAWLLSINRQRVRLNDGVFSYHGSEVNVPLPDTARWTALAQAIARAVPGLAGYVGVDLMAAEDGSLTVLEINPRLTTSYVGLHRAIGLNPALCVVDLLYNQSSLDSFALAHNMVNVTLHG